MFDAKKYIKDAIYGERLLISKQADTTELGENIRVARVLLSCFVDINIRINEHLLIFGHKNPEYTINERLADRKGVESEHGVKSAFRKAIASGNYERHEDFASGRVSECYVVHNGKAVVVKHDVFASSEKDIIKHLIEELLEKLRT